MGSITSRVKGLNCFWTDYLFRQREGQRTLTDDHARECDDPVIESSVKPGEDLAGYRGFSPRVHKPIEED